MTTATSVATVADAKDVYRLSVCAALTAGLVIAELVLGHFSHCLTLLALTNQTLYNLLTLIFTIVAKQVFAYFVWCFPFLPTAFRKPAKFKRSVETMSANRIIQ
jgi:hypothetical protein